MMRLWVTVWKAIVATPWHSATTAITAMDVTRSSAIRQKPSVPKGSGLSQASRPRVNSPASATSTAVRRR